MMIFAYAHWVNGMAITDSVLLFLKTCYECHLAVLEYTAIVVFHPAGSGPYALMWLIRFYEDP